MQNTAESANRVIYISYSISAEKYFCKSPQNI